MAVTQYIGARYVPKFYEGSSGSEWDANVVYDPLTIVTWIGSSWTSKKAVPATVGAPNLNPDYWVNTGNFNQQVAALSDDIGSVRTESEAADAELDTRVSSTERGIAELSKKLTVRTATDIKANFIGLYDCFDTQIGCLVKYGTTLWTIEGVSTVSGETKASNTGRIKEWNWSTGALVSDNQVTTGHANSCCYNPVTQCLYIAPTWDYTVSGRPSARYIYKVSYPGYTVQKILTGDVNALALCYDHVTSKQYLIGYDAVIYNYDAENDTISTFMDVSSFGLNNVGSALMQDVVIRNNTMFWTTARNQLGQYDLSANNPVITYLNIDTVDSTNTFDMGEVEGFNFDESGHLMVSFMKVTTPNITVHSLDQYTYRNSTGFICEIPTNIAVPFNKYYLPNNIINQTLTIRNLYNTFKLQDSYSLNTMFQFAALLDPPTRMRLGSDFDAAGKCNRLSIYKQCLFDFNGHALSHWNGFGVSGGSLTVEGTGTINMMDDYNEVFYAGRGGLTLVAGAILTITNIREGNANYINTGTDSELILDFATVTADGDLKVSTMDRERWAVYAGSRKIIDPA